MSYSHLSSKSWWRVSYFFMFSQKGGGKTLHVKTIFDVSRIVISCFVFPLYGLLSDRYGRKLVLYILIAMSLLEGSSIVVRSESLSTVPVPGFLYDLLAVLYFGKVVFLPIFRVHDYRVCSHCRLWKYQRSHLSLRICRSFLWGYNLF